MTEPEMPQDQDEAASTAPPAEAPDEDVTQSASAREGCVARVSRPRP